MKHSELAVLIYMSVFVHESGKCDRIVVVDAEERMKKRCMYVYDQRLISWQCRGEENKLLDRLVQFFVIDPRSRSRSRVVVGNFTNFVMKESYSTRVFGVPIIFFVLSHEQPITNFGSW